MVRLTQLDGKMPNLALMKLAAYHRDRGDEPTNNEDEREKVVELAKRSTDPRQRLARNPERLQQLLGRVCEEGYCTREYAAYREGGVGIPLLINGAPVGGIVMRYQKTAMKFGQIQADYLPELRNLAAQIGREFQASGGFG